MTQNHYKILLLTGLMLVASVLGILALYSHTIMPGLKHTDDVTFVRSFQAIDRQIINPVFMLQFFAPVFILGLAAFYAHKHRLAEAKYIFVALACYVIAVLITMAVNVPLNDGIKKLTNLQSPESFANARAQFQESKWLVFNHLRTIFTLLSTISTAVAVWIARAL